MRNKIFGGIGILWGGAMLVSWLLSDTPAAGSAAYESGRSFAVLFGAALFLAGLYYFFKRSA